MKLPRPQPVDAAEPPDLRRWIRPGDTVVIGQAHAEPLALTRALAQQRHALGGVRLLLGIGASESFGPAMADHFEFLSYCASGSNRRLGDALDILPCNYSDIARWIADGQLKVDVLMLQVSPRDELGRFTYGLACDYLAAARARARHVLAEVNAHVPWTYGETALVRDDFDLIVHSDAAPAFAGPAEPGDSERAVARNVAALVEDGATLQVGIGAIPDAVLQALTTHRDLGLHTGTVSDSVLRLVESGALTNARKSIDAGVGVAAFLMGGRALARFAHRNPRLRVRSAEYTHAPAVLASHERFTAINSAIEVDLTGQVNAEAIGSRYVGAVGGGPEFLRAAQRSRGGLPVVALTSTAAGRSRIVSRLSGPVSTARSDAGVVVTEHGAADLRGLPLLARIERMIGIAAPPMRPALEAEAEEMFRLRARRPNPTPH